MYDYLPMRKSITARLLVLGLFLLSAASFVASGFTPSPYHTIPQAVGLILIIPLIQVMTRFVILRYLYRIAPYEDGNVDLEIYAYRGGSKMQLVCRIVHFEPRDVRHRDVIEVLRILSSSRL